MARTVRIESSAFHGSGAMRSIRYSNGGVPNCASPAFTPAA